MIRDSCDRSKFTRRLLTIGELVAEIGGTKWYWRCRIWEGRLPYIQVGRKMLIDALDVENFIKKNKFQN